MLLITGTQRSGTSLIATALAKSGHRMEFGAPWDQVGGFENELICGFYQKYLGDPTFPWENYSWPDVEPGQFAALGCKVAKFSFLLMNPAFVTIWHKFRPLLVTGSRRSPDTFLVMNRDKQHLVASKQRNWGQFQHDSFLLQQSADELRINMQTSVGLLLHFGYNFQVLHFPQCTSDLAKINDALGLLDSSIQIDPKVWEEVFDPTKIHFI